MLDNVKFHHSKLVKKYAEEKGIELLCVPPYSPWFNPIEGVFSVVKRHYYAHGSIDDAFQVVSAQHMNAFFQKSMSLDSGPECRDHKTRTRVRSHMCLRKNKLKDNVKSLL